MRWADGRAEVHEQGGRRRRRKNSLRTRKVRAPDALPPGVVAHRVEGPECPRGSRVERRVPVPETPQRLQQPPKDAVQLLVLEGNLGRLRPAAGDEGMNAPVERNGGRAGPRD